MSSFKANSDGHLINHEIVAEVKKNFMHVDYQMQNNVKVIKNVPSTSPKNLIQPILVKKSYLYRGTPPRIADRNKSVITILSVNTNV